MRSEKQSVKEYTSVKLNGISLTDFSIALLSENEMPAATALAQRLHSLSGIKLSVQIDPSAAENITNVFLLGASYRTGNGATGLDGYLINCYNDPKGLLICINASDAEAYSNAFEDLFGKATVEENDGALSVTFKQGTVYSVNLQRPTGTEHEYVQWDLAEETKREISRGVVYTEQLFYEDNELPNRVYLLTVDPTHNVLDMGSSDDGFDYALPDRSRWQTTEDHMRAAVNHGKKVVAGINADFFDIDDGYLLDDYHPFGVTIKEGRVISLGSLDSRPAVGITGNERPFFGVTAQNQAVIAMESEYSEDMKLEMAVGGAYILAKDRKTVFIKQQHNIIHGGVHPRALAGICSDGTVILAAIDGRQEQHSIGASLLQCSLLLHRQGAAEGILFDGGGSACMVLRDIATDTYTTVDKPCDGWLRKIYNSVIVIAK